MRTHVFLEVNTGRVGLQEVHLSEDSEQVTQSGWQDVHGDVVLGWKVPDGQLDAVMQAPLTANCPAGQVKQNPEEPSHDAQDEEHAEVGIESVKAK